MNKREILEYAKALDLIGRQVVLASEDILNLQKVWHKSLTPVKYSPTPLQRQTRPGNCGAIPGHVTIKMLFLLTQKLKSYFYTILNPLIIKVLI